MISPRLILLSIASISIISTIMFLHLNSVAKREVNDKLVMQTYEVMDISKELIKNTLEAESALMSYVITKDTVFLQPFKTTVASTRKLMLELKLLTAYNPVQQLRLDTLNELIHQRYENGAEQIMAISIDSTSAEAQVSISEEGNEIMDQLHGVSIRFIAEEQTSVLNYGKSASKLNQESILISVIGVTVVLAMFGLLFVLLYKENKARKITVHELFLKNEWLKKIMISIGDGLIAIDTNGIITLINESALFITGWEKHETIGKHIDNVYKIEDEVTGIKITNPAIDAIQKDKIIPLANHTILKQKNGDIISIDDSGAPIYNEANDTIGAVLIFRDVTDKKKAEDALKDLNQSLEKRVEERTSEVVESEKRIRTSLDNMMEGVQIIDFDWRYQYVNDAICRQVKSSKEEMIGYTMMEKYPGIEHTEVFKVLQRCMTSRISHRMDNEFVFPDAAKGWFEITIQPVPEGLIILTIDVTDRKKAEEQFRISEIFSSAVLASLGSHIAVIDANGNVESVNKAWEDFAKANNETILPRVSEESNYFDVCNKALLEGDIYAQQAIDGIKAVLNQEKETFQLEYPCHSPEKQRWFILNVSKFGDEHKVVTSHIDVTDRKMAEFANQASELKYMHLFESAKDGILILNAQTGKIQDVNPQLIEILGYSYHYFIGKELWEIGLFKKVDTSYITFLELQDKEYIHYENLPLETESGIQLNVEFVSNAYMVGDGKVIQCNIRDITERVAAEQYIVESELRLLELFENAPQSNVVMDVNNNLRFTRANNNAVLLLKSSMEELLKMSPTDISPEFQPDGSRSDLTALEIVAKVMAEGTQVFDWTIINAEGKEIVCEVRLSRLSATNEDLVLASLSDITEKRKSEENLRKSEIRLNEAQAISHTANWEIDLITNENTWSDEFYKIIGLVKGTIDPNPESFFNLLNAADRDLAEKGFKEGFGTLTDTRYELSFMRDDSLRHAYMEWKIEYDKDNNPLRLYGILQDITDRRAVEETLEKQNQELTKTNSELDKFVYSTSHDLRAPLTSMLGLINIIDESIAPEETDQKERIGMMKKSIDKLDSFIENIITYSRNSRIGIEKEEINFGELINESRQSLKYMEGKTEAKINVEVEQEGMFISDRGRILINLNNLISNAVKYQDKEKPNSYVNIKVQSDEFKAILTVADNGIGIETGKIEKIFDMFYRATKLSKGSGLGLYIAKETVTKLNGTIAIESELNVGSTFTITIPNMLKIN